MKTATHRQSPPAAGAVLPAPRGFGAAPAGRGGVPGAAAPIQRSGRGGRGRPSLKRNEPDEREDDLPSKRRMNRLPANDDDDESSDSSSSDESSDESSDSSSSDESSDESSDSSSSDESSDDSSDSSSSDESSDSSSSDSSSSDSSSDESSDSSSSDESDGVPPVRQGRPRLLVGEGDLSFARALGRKHPGVNRNTDATTYEPADYQKKAYASTGPANKRVVKKRGMRVLHGVNATSMASDKRLASRYPRIHFNFPHTGQRDGSTAKVIDGFFGNARRMQKTGDRVRMGLVMSENKKTNSHYKGVYGLGKAAGKHRYKLVRKRKFGSDRFPGYQHRETNQGQSAPSAAGGGREFVFERVGTDDEFDPRAQPYPAYEMDTEDESSDYTDPDEEPSGLKQEQPRRRDDDSDDDDTMGGGGMGLAQLRPGLGVT